MHPAPSVILFTTLSGLGFGLLAWLGAFGQFSGLAAFVWWGLGYGLAVGGLLASTFHLGNPQRFLRAFTQWRSSWLSREAIASCATLIWLAPLALAQWVGWDWPRWWGLVGAALALVTVFTTSMIYAQLKTVPRWNHWLVPVKFLCFAVTGGGLLIGAGAANSVLSLVLGLVLLAYWRLGDFAFEERGASLGTATGLGGMGKLRVFEQAHTADNYLMREMMFHVGRKHRDKLRLIAMFCLVAFPPLCLLLVPYGALAWALAAALHLIGALAARWLFFAEAEHVVGLYYGRHQTP